MKLILRFVRDALKQMARELNVLYQTTVEYWIQFRSIFNDNGKEDFYIYVYVCLKTV